MGKMGLGKTGDPGENGFPGDKGAPEEDGEVEKAAQLLCSREVPLWNSAREESVLRFQSSIPCAFPRSNPRFGRVGTELSTYHWMGWGGGLGEQAMVQAPPEGEKGAHSHSGEEPSLGCR